MAVDSDCGCEAGRSSAVNNPPGLAAVAYRAGTFASFRRHLLMSLTAPPGPEAVLDTWRPAEGNDLGLQMLEWWAYLGDILTFYNERIANEMLLRTASQPESVNRLIRLIGYRPRPGLAARGQLVALATGHQPTTLPHGLSFDSKPGPGEQPQTFELDEAVTIWPKSEVAAEPARRFLGAGCFYVGGGRLPFDIGDTLLLRSAGAGTAGSWLLKVLDTRVEKLPRGGVRTRVMFSSSGGTALPAGPAEELRLDYAAQSMPVWPEKEAIADSEVHLANLARDIRAGDRVMFLGGKAAVLSNVSLVSEVVWYPNHLRGQSPSQAPPSRGENSVPAVAVLHTQLSLDASPPSQLSTAYFGWRRVEALLNQPSDRLDATASTATLQAGTAFPNDRGSRVVIADVNGDGVLARAVPWQAELAVSEMDRAASLIPPLTVHYNLLPVSRGKTVLNEVLGSGNAAVPGQEFVLKQSPLTYLARGNGYFSTLQLRVNGNLWREVPNFHEQPRNAMVFTTMEDEEQRTHVRFGDGVNGARLPTGFDNVNATYRYGSGARSPAAGSITVINKPYPGLAAVRNPAAVGGGADPDPPSGIKRFAPGSVMTFGRAMSGDDYLTIASRAPGVTRVQAAWSFDAAQQRAAVKIYVGDNGAAVDAARAAIAVVGDPHRHVLVEAATPVSVKLSLIVSSDGIAAPDDIVAAVRRAMLDDEAGVFGVRRLGVAQAVFRSEVSAACLGCPGVVALHRSVFATGGIERAGARYAPDEGAFFKLADGDLTVSIEGG